jgi:hypothetical protein
MRPDVAMPAQDRAAHQHICGLRRFSGTHRPGESAGGPGCDDDGAMKTRTLLLLALVTGIAILAAGAVQILMAKQ